MHALHSDDVSKSIWEGFSYRTLLPAEVGGALSVYLLTIAHANLHRHESEDQIYIVHTGRGIMEVANEQQEVEPGCLVYIPRGHWHALTPLDEQPVIVYSIVHQVL